MNFKEAREILIAGRDRYPAESPCRINTGLTVKQAWDILWAAVAGAPDDAKVHDLTANNIARAFGDGKRIKRDDQSKAVDRAADQVAHELRRQQAMSDAKKLVDGWFER